MANTYSQVHLHFVIAVKYRQALIDDSIEEEVHKYISGIIQNNSHKLLCIGGMPDHVHILVGFNTTQSIADFMSKVKSNSSRWINENRKTKFKFEWQDGYGVFSCSKSHMNNVISYLNNQKEHHRLKSFTEEFTEFLKIAELEFDVKYILKEADE